jgi:transcriptional regulator with XRE-family HTH domain
MGKDELLLRLGDRVRRLRKQRGWTQTIMAEKVGIDRTFLAEVETGRRNIAIFNLYLIAKSLNLSLAQLLSGIRDK